MLKQKQNLQTLTKKDLIETLHPENIYKNSKNYYKIINNIKETIKKYECKKNNCEESHIVIENLFFNQKSKNFEIELYNISKDINEPIFIWEKKYSLVKVLEILEI